MGDLTVLIRDHCLSIYFILVVYQYFTLLFLSPLVMQYPRPAQRIFYSSVYFYSFIFAHE